MSVKGDLDAAASDVQPHPPHPPLSINGEGGSRARDSQQEVAQTRSSQGPPEPLPQTRPCGIDHAHERGVGHSPVTGHAHVLPETLELARRFRKTPTGAEKTAWALLRARKVHGLKFRRQQAIRGFVVDFYCAQHHLVLELDGPIHDAQKEYDDARTKILESMGVRIVRVRNEDLSAELLDALLAHCAAGA